MNTFVWIHFCFVNLRFFGYGFFYLILVFVGENREMMDF